MKLPILAQAFAAATILLTTSSLTLQSFAAEEKPYGAYEEEKTQSVSPQADQKYKAPSVTEHKAGKAEEAGKGDHKAGGSHKSGYPPHVRFYPGRGHGFWRGGHFIPYHRHW